MISRKPKKILYVIGQLGIGGAERQLYYTVKYINRRKYSPTVVSLSKGGYWAERIRRLEIEVIELQRKGSFDLSRLLQLIKICRDMRPSIVHTFMYSANTYGRIAAFIVGVPVVIASERNAYELKYDKTFLQIFVDKILALNTELIICNSKYAADSMINRYSFSAKKICVVYNGINLDAYSNSNLPRKRNKNKIVGIVGSLTAAKNHKLFLDAAKITTEKYGQAIKYYIIGDGYLGDKLMKYAQQLGIINNTLFMGSRNDVSKLLQEMNVFVLTSNYEGLPNAIMEAMASGLPCVATNVGGNSELVVDGKTGFVVPPNDPLALAEKILTLLDDGNMAEEKGNSGLEKIQKEFGVRKMTEEIEKIYEKSIVRHQV